MKIHKKIREDRKIRTELNKIKETMKADSKNKKRSMEQKTSTKRISQQNRQLKRLRFSCSLNKLKYSLKKYKDR